MITFQASKFNPETDSDRPKLNSEFDHEGKKYSLKKVEHIEAGDIMKMVMEGKEPDKKGFDEVLFHQHTTRLFVNWVCYVNEVKKPKKKNKKKK